MQTDGHAHPIVAALGREPGIPVIEPPGAGPGYWAGGPSAIWHDEAIWLAYRLRRPVDRGRGYANVVARSTDGIEFETVSQVTSDELGAASLERPALVVAPDGTWRLYVSCSTEGSKHWWVEMLEAPSPEKFPSARRQVVLPGNEAEAWKDPVVLSGPDGWRMWACRHDIIPAEEADRMDSWYLTSGDGADWQLRGRALAPTPGTWDARGVRIASVWQTGQGADAPWLALYDGRATKAENWEERTGLAVGTGPDRFTAVPDGPLVAAPVVRYVAVVALPDGGWRAYYESGRDDGSHDLRVAYVPRPTGLSQSAKDASSSSPSSATSSS